VNEKVPTLIENKHLGLVPRALLIRSHTRNTRTGCGLDERRDKTQEIIAYADSSLIFVPVSTNA
jgi:hypothetical protein